MEAQGRRAWRFLMSVAGVGAVLVLYQHVVTVNATTVALSLLLVVLAVSARWGLAEATLASVLGLLGLNYYFLEPVGTFTIEDPQNWMALVAFLVTAVTASQLSERVRRRAAEAEERRLEIERLYELVQAMMPGGTPQRALRDFVQRVTQVFHCDAAAFYYLPGDEVIRSGPESNAVSDHDLQAAAEVEELTVDAARTRATTPIRLGGHPLGSMALLGPLPSDQTLLAIVNLIALTIEKARALEDASHMEAARHNEVLKSALLDSLAHDIKTPLTSIKAAVTSLLGGAAEPDRELLTIINEEADRLNLLAAEVIAMARVEAGKLHLDKHPVEAARMVEAALSELGGLGRGRAVAVTAQRNLPHAWCDTELVQQVIKHLIENALKYSPEGSPVKITAEQKGEKIVIGVADSGVGIDEDERSRIFDKFFRGRRFRFETKGTGMGLAIAKGIMEAHGEKIWVESEPGQGSVFYISLPVAKEGGQ
jgi:two-component system, OmpR family, sensor histidine kinase KdpD